MVQAAVKSLSIEEFLAIPETEPESEFFDREIIQKPMPKGKHSAIQGEFTSCINSALRLKRIARAFPELRCTFGGMSIVPDISVFRWDRIVRDANGEIANIFNMIRHTSSQFNIFFEYSQYILYLNSFISLQ